MSVTEENPTARRVGVKGTGPSITLGAEKAFHNNGGNFPGQLGGLCD